MDEMYTKSFNDGTLVCKPMSPIELFHVKNGRMLRSSSGKYSITLFLEPFIWNDEQIDTEIRLDSINFNNLNVQELSGKEFSFPLNPTNGYIDGSIYLEGSHNPIDVFSICFGARLNELSNELNDIDYIASTILYKFCWEGYKSDFYPEVKRSNAILRCVIE